MAGNNGDGTRRKSAYQQQVESEGRERARTAGAVHQAGGGSGIAEFFSKDNRERPIKRGELLGLLELLEYSRKAHTWWRRLGRFATGTPGPTYLAGQMANAYRKNTLAPAIAAVKEQLERDAAKANAEIK